MVDMAKPGPKPKPAAEVRSQRVNFMARADEHAAYLKAAEQADKSMADWIRDTLNRTASREKKNQN